MPDGIDDANSSEFRSILPGMSDAKRIRLLKAALAVAFFLGILLAKRLWISDRLYPRTPLLEAFSYIAPWMDYLASLLLLILLVVTLFTDPPGKHIVAILMLTTFLFLEDQSRLWPSFYEYAVLFLALAFCSWKADDSNTSRYALNACRLAIVCVYVWTGAQKITPFFQDQFASIFTPIMRLVPFKSAALIHWGSILVPFFEIGIGFGLLFKKTRMLALAEALVMHGMLFFLLGPFRAHWNVGAWMWNLASAFIVFILFFRAEDFPAHEIIINRRFPVHQVILVLFGIVPALSFANLWDSALSFNVYSGNITRGTLYVSGALAGRLPGELRQYVVRPVGAEKSNDPYVFDMYSWSLSEFGAEPYPETRIFQSVATALCRYATTPSDIVLQVTEKRALWEQPAWFDRFRAATGEGSDISGNGRCCARPEPIVR